MVSASGSSGFMPGAAQPGGGMATVKMPSPPPASSASAATGRHPSSAAAPAVVHFRSSFLLGMFETPKNGRWATLFARHYTSALRGQHLHDAHGAVVRDSHIDPVL